MRGMISDLSCRVDFVRGRYTRLVLGAEWRFVALGVCAGYIATGSCFESWLLSSGGMGRSDVGFVAVASGEGAWDGKFWHTRRSLFLETRLCDNIVHSYRRLALFLLLYPASF